MARTKTKIEKHPASLAWDRWLESEDGKRCMKLPVTEPHFLKNRLFAAFMTAWDDGEKYCLQKLQTE